MKSHHRGGKQDQPEEQDDLERLQVDFNLTTSTSIELQPKKKSLIEVLAKMERNKQEQLSLARITRKQSASSIPTAEDKNLDQIYEKRRSKYNQCIKLSNHQHDESPSYYNECITRLSVYDELNTKSIQLQIDDKSIQQKNEPDLQCQNQLNNYQDSLSYEKKKFEEGGLVHSTLTELDIKIQQLVDNEIIHMKKQLELEREIRLLEQKSLQLKSSEQSQQTNAEQINLDSKRSTNE